MNDECPGQRPGHSSSGGPGGNRTRTCAVAGLRHENRIKILTEGPEVVLRPSRLKQR
jgi:hypothetical protein